MGWSIVRDFGELAQSTNALSLISPTEQKKHDPKNVKTHRNEISHFYLIVQLPLLTPLNRVSINPVFSLKNFSIYFLNGFEIIRNTNTNSYNTENSGKKCFALIWIAFIFSEGYTVTKSVLWQRLSPWRFRCECTL